MLISALVHLAMTGLLEGIQQAAYAEVAKVVTHSMCSTVLSESSNCEDHVPDVNQELVPLHAHFGCEHLLLRARQPLEAGQEVGIQYAIL